MKYYIIKRLLLTIPMLIGISIIMFVVMHLAPGDPTSMRYGLNPEVSQGARANFNRMYGLDEPLHVQYGMWIKRLLTLDFGRSLIDDRPVIDKVASRLPATVLLQAVSILLIISIAIPLGAAGGLKRGSFFDKVTTVFVFVGYAMPTFWLALILIFIFGFKLGWLPVSGMTPWYADYLPFSAKAGDLAWHLVLPVVTTAFGGLAALSRYSRSSMIEVLREPYILTARAKGLSENRVVFVHALKNALLPIVTILGLTLPALISGSFIFETIFAWPGMGRLGYEAIMNYDYPVIMGVGVMATLLTLLGIFISDVLYAVVDPRIRLGGE
ncbi:MAG: ABC transporter permease subunit [Candidatus Omnitrophica bacterium]|nr:ABC transporter permease subunit [Candidatus Omnitrophota bacterium]